MSDEKLKIIFPLVVFSLAVGATLLLMPRGEPKKTYHYWYIACKAEASKQGLMQDENYILGQWQCANIALQKCQIDGCENE